MTISNISISLPNNNPSKPVVDLDNIIYQLLDYSAFAIDKYLGSYYSQLAVKLSIPTAIIGSKSYLPLHLIGLSKDWIFPILQVEHTNNKFKKASNNNYHCIYEFKLQFILPTLPLGKMQYIYPILNAVDTVLTGAFNTNQDTSYNNNNKAVSCESITSVNTEYGSLQLNDFDEFYYPSIIKNIEISTVINDDMSGVEYGLWSGSDGYIYEDNFDLNIVNFITPEPS
jgi:hypothetical protein